MKSGIIILIILLIVSIICGIIVYTMYNKGYFNDKSTTESPKYPEIGFVLTIKDSLTKDKIKSDFILIKNNPIDSCLSQDSCNLYKQNITSFYLFYPELLESQIREDCCYLLRVDNALLYSGFLIDNYNTFLLNESNTYTMFFNDKKYYFSSLVINSELNGSNQDIFLNKKAEILNISAQGLINTYQDNNFRLHLVSDSYLNSIILCFKWSFNVVNVKSSYEKITSPARLKNIDTCYKTNSSLMSSNNFTRDFDFTTKTLDLNNQDYIQVYVIDEDYYLNDQYEVNYGKETVGNKNNVGAQDFMQIIIPVNKI